MNTLDFGVDLKACRENLRQRQARRYRERETQRQAARTAVLAAIRTVLPEYPQVQRIYLYGSITHPGTFGAQSDVDIAVEGTNAEDYFTLWRDLQEAAPEWEIDLREINQPCYFSDTVRQRGELIYERKHATSQV